MTYLVRNMETGELQKSPGDVVTTSMLLLTPDDFINGKGCPREAAVTAIRKMDLKSDRFRVEVYDGLLPLDIPQTPPSALYLAVRDGDNWLLDHLTIA